MRRKTGAAVRRAAQALMAGAMVAAGVIVCAGPAHALLPVPTISSVFATGASPTRVVTAGTTVLITGTGFAGMEDNNANPACSVTPVASSRCVQVRFNGVSANANATGYTLATEYVVVSDTQIYVTVPEITAIAPAAGAPAAGTGSIRVVVVNTQPWATSSLASAPGSTISTELLYRERLGATVQNGPVSASPLGGATVVVDVTDVATLTIGTIAAEKITAYFVSVINGSPSVKATSVTFNDGDSVNVVVPPGTPAGELVGIMLVHDGIMGTADDDSLSYAAVISQVDTCEAFTPPITGTPPVCTGPANTSANPIYVRLTGKGLTGATGFSFDGADGATDEDCSVASDTVAYCSVTVNTIPSFPVVAVTFTPADLDGAGPATAPAVAAVGVGSIFGFFD